MLVLVKLYHSFLESLKNSGHDTYSFYAMVRYVNRIAHYRNSGGSRPWDNGGAWSPKKFFEFQYILYTSISHVLLAQSNYLLILANDLAGGLLAWTSAHWTSGFNSNLLSKKNYSSQRNRRDCFWALGDAWMENERQKFDNWVDQLYWPSERDSKAHVPLADDSTQLQVICLSEGWKRHSKILSVYAMWY